MPLTMSSDEVRQLLQETQEEMDDRRSGNGNGTFSFDVNGPQGLLFNLLLGLGKGFLDQIELRTVKAVKPKRKKTTKRTSRSS